MQTDMRLIRVGEDAILIDLEPAAKDQALRHLTMYSIGRDAQVADASDERALVSLIGPRAAEVAATAPLPEFANEPTQIAGVDVPTGALDLDPADSPSPYRNLIDVQSPWYPGYVYVVPNHPEQSLLFMKVDCDDPGGNGGAGARMPLDNYAGGLTVQQIALIYDWIAEGAPAGTTDGIFRNGFDVRGFAQ